MLSLLFAAALLAAGDPAPKPADGSSACPPVLTTGSPDVSTEGKSAGRVGDGRCAVASQGSDDVIINGLPALRVGDKVTCPNGKIGVVTGGASTVFVNGRPKATAGSRITGCD